MSREQEIWKQVAGDCIGSGCAKANLLARIEARDAEVSAQSALIREHEQRIAELTACCNVWHEATDKADALIRELAAELRTARDYAQSYGSPDSLHDKELWRGRIFLLARIDALLVRAEKEQSNER